MIDLQDERDFSAAAAAAADEESDITFVMLLLLLQLTDATFAASSSIEWGISMHLWRQERWDTVAHTNGSLQLTSTCIQREKRVQAIGHSVISEEGEEEK